MGLLAETIAACARRARLHAEKQLAGIPAELFARRPVVNGKLIETNHPAFVFGHLSLYPARVLQYLGQDARSATVPESWFLLFRPGAPCLDDADGHVYPAMNALTSTFFRAIDAGIAGVLATPDETFGTQTPDEHYRAFFPTVGAAALSMLNNHMMFHLGQVSAWRRCVGLGPTE